MASRKQLQGTQAEAHLRCTAAARRWTRHATYRMPQRIAASTYCWSPPCLPGVPALLLPLRRCGSVSATCAQSSSL